MRISALHLSVPPRSLDTRNNHLLLRYYRPCSESASTLRLNCPLPMATEAADPGREQRRAQKKAAKAAKRLQAETAQQQSLSADVQHAERSGGKPGKKRKAADSLGGAAKRMQQPAGEQPSKKERKRLKRAALDAVAAAAPPQPTAKGPAHEAQEEQPQLASVGDVAAARAGPPVVKALYAEHAAVAALTEAEVAAWRAERATAVSGGQWKPVLEFSHAGTACVARLAGVRRRAGGDGLKSVLCLLTCTAAEGRPAGDTCVLTGTKARCSVTLCGSVCTTPTRSRPGCWRRLLR